MIRVEGLEKTYPGAARATLRGVSFLVPSGRLAAVLGDSGAGKSTLLRCLVGLEPFEAGIVDVDGVAARGGEGAAARSALRGRVGMVPQSFDLFPHLSALENCALAPRLVRRERRAVAEERASRLLSRLGLERERDAFPEQLSGGQRQRVAIARAMAMEPRVLVYDEPTSSLDSSLRGEVRRTLLAVRESGVTQLVVTHDLELVRTAVEWVFVLQDGAIARQGAPAELLG